MLNTIHNYIFKYIIIKQNMKPLNFSRQSWHYQLASFGSNYVSTNICSYIWQVLWGVVAVVAVSLVLSMLCGLPLISIIIIMFVGYEPEILFGSEFNIVGLGALIFTIYALCGILWCLIELVPSKIKSIIKKTTVIPDMTSDNFLYSAWSKFKDKTCVKIRFYN